MLVSRHGLRLEVAAERREGWNSSTRRKAQLLAYRRDLQIVPLRGNVDTRLRKAETEQLDAIVLAAVGCFDWGEATKQPSFYRRRYALPAVGQGALAVQVEGR